ncbi:MAG: aldo/keto reductase [Mucilaginibacter sp.]
MRKVELVKGIQSSVLGFGCAPILGSVGAKTALRAIDCAIDCGITHFDLARSYGYGEAERFVGNALRNKRDMVVLTSKFGITANWKADILRPIKPSLRFVLNHFKKQQSEKTTQIANAGPIVANQFHNHIDINSKTMRSSLEKSLKALKTDYLDYFLIHEPLQKIANIDQLIAMSEKLKAEGKIRAWGMAFIQSQKHIHADYLNQFDILQFDNSPGMMDYETTLAERGPKPNVFFSTIKGGPSGLTPAEKLNQLADDFPNSVLLCSMFNQQHIIANTKLFNS